MNRSLLNTTIIIIISSVFMASCGDSEKMEQLQAENDSLREVIKVHELEALEALEKAKLGLLKSQKRAIQVMDSVIFARNEKLIRIYPHCEDMEYENFEGLDTLNTLLLEKEIFLSNLTTYKNLDSCGYVLIDGDRRKRIFEPIQKTDYMHEIEEFFRISL